MNLAPVAIGLLFLLVACGSDPVAPSDPSPSPPSPTSATNPLLGDWRWTRSCDAVVAAFREAGLADATRMWLVETRYFSREDQIEAADPCNGAKETSYVYFFGSGRWGLIDDDDVLVDDRPFEIVGDETIAFEDIEIDHRTDGDTLTFEVRRPDACDADCLETYAWAVATFAPATLERAA